MARYREHQYKLALERAVEILDAVFDLVDEVKRKTSAKSAHKVLDQIVSMTEKHKIHSCNLITKLEKDDAPK